jgi:ABC-type thiamin/hydroxymethylpyrimidine transport system permease subunit
MDKVVGVVMLVGLVIGIALGVWWLLWLLWVWVMPQIWPTGPQQFTSPNYWLFVGAWFLLACIGKLLFPRK